MKKLKIITAVSFSTAVASLIYAAYQKAVTDSKVYNAEINTILKYKCVSRQDVFPHPTRDTLEIFTSESCKTMAHHINTSTYSDSDYGNLIRECVVVVLKELATVMEKGENLSQYFSKK